LEAIPFWIPLTLQRGQGGNSQRIRGSALGHPADTEVTSFLLQAENKKLRWAAATPGAVNAAQYQLLMQRPVMPIGGFNGGTPYPTVSQFNEYIETGQIRYYIVRHDSQDIEAEAQFADEVTQWVRANFVPLQLGEMDVFDLHERLLPALMTCPTCCKKAERNHVQILR
jgi:hypothetical protein